jgi:sugar phosphate isomerase/epimerase
MTFCEFIRVEDLSCFSRNMVGAGSKGWSSIVQQDRRQVSRQPRIRIGTQSGFSAVPFLAPFEYAVEHGFEAFEWLPDKKESGAGWEEKDVDSQTRASIRDTCVEHDIRGSVHAPFDVDLVNPDHRERLSETIEFVHDIGASLLNVHLCTDQGLDAYVRGIISLTRMLGQNGIMLAVENTPLTLPEDFNSFFKRLRRLAPEAKTHVGMCLDLGHANLCPATRNDYLKFMDLLAPEVPIVHLHLHENYGDSDSHLTIFTGPSVMDDRGIRGFVKRMKKRAFSGCIILEQWPDPPSLLDAARDKLRAMFMHTIPPSIPVSS